jgi:hypothetical protein
MSYRSQESKRIPFVERACFLEKAVAPGFPQTYRQCISYPPTEGLQPCLILGTNDGVPAVTDVLAVIPAGAPNASPESSIYCNYLGLIEHAQRKEIARLRVDDDMIRSWRGATWTEPPFRSLLLNKFLAQVDEFLAVAKVKEAAGTGAMGALNTARTIASQWTIPYLKKTSLKTVSVTNAIGGFWSTGQTGKRANWISTIGFWPIETSSQERCPPTKHTGA